MSNYVVEALEPMTLEAKGRLKQMYVLSPFVWREGEIYHLLVRAVPQRDDEPRLKMAEIWYGVSRDGLHFVMDDGPVLFPGPDLADLDGCEDPTVLMLNGRYLVWYTGWNQAQATGRLLYAEGETPRDLSKRGIAIDSREGLGNPKEATAARAPDGGWRLFFEFARDGASAIGLASSESERGPWAIQMLDLPARPGRWDDWHLSTGPVIGAGSDRPVMFYNGASREAHWRIGWVAFDTDMTRVVARSEDPVITPDMLKDGWTDIAFASSAIEMGDETWLYFSIADRDIQRARLRTA